MAEFTCRLGTPTGEVVTRTIEAAAERDLRSKLEREGFRVFSVSSSGSAGISRALGGESRTRKIKTEDFLLFNQQLSALLRAGLPILQAIGILRKRVPNERLRLILEDVEEKVRSGQSLSQAFGAQGEVFPRIYIASILAGERSGSLDGVLLRYVSYQKTINDARRKIKKSLAYPSVLVGASILLVMVLSTYVIPKFMQLYGSVGSTQLPTVTVLVVSTAEFISKNLTWLIPTVIGIIVFLLYWRRTPSGRLTLDRWALKTPVVGETIRQLTIAQFTRSLATLLAGGITLPESVDIASESITNRALRQASLGVLIGIREGRSFTESLEQAGWVSELALDMIGVGERSGALREMLDEVANFYDAELDVRLSTITTFIEPVILIFMGSLVMTILLAMYLPLFNMIGNIGGQAQ
ncbi:MAG TPA: type II secretion system F family protein [Blastocatellia bacterium]|jgi:type IV pilus assembly protein PilC|nr:type II secretion system F family protein [Blastocatellia bacterium]